MSASHDRMLFVNLPVRELARSVVFFTRLGFGFDPKFTDERATCMIVSDKACVMLLEDSRFRDFTRREICDPATHSEALITVSQASRDAVDAMAEAAGEAGAKAAMEPQDHGFMYGRSFYDLDGHHWEVFWMDPELADTEA